MKNSKHTRSKRGRTRETLMFSLPEGRGKQESKQAGHLGGRRGWMGVQEKKVMNVSLFL